MTLRPLALAAVAIVGAGVYLLVTLGRAPADAVAAAPAAPLAAKATSESASARPRPVMPEAPRSVAAAPRGTAVGSAAPSFRAPPIERLIREAPNPQLRPMMDQANQAFLRRDYKQATTIATKVLAKDPNNVAMLRVMGSAACAQGDSAKAQKYYDRLPTLDRDQMKARCSRGNPGITTLGEDIKASLAHSQQ